MISHEVIVQATITGIREPTVRAPIHCHAHGRGATIPLVFWRTRCRTRVKVKIGNIIRVTVPVISTGINSNCVCARSRPRTPRRRPSRQRMPLSRWEQRMPPSRWQHRIRPFRPRRHRHPARHHDRDRQDQSGLGWPCGDYLRHDLGIAKRPPQGRQFAVDDATGEIPCCSDKRSWVD